MIVKHGPQTFEAVVNLTDAKVMSWKEVKGIQPGCPDARVEHPLRKSSWQIRTGRQPCANGVSPVSKVWCARR